MQFGADHSEINRALLQMRIERELRRQLRTFAHGSQDHVYLEDIHLRVERGL